MLYKKKDLSHFFDSRERQLYILDLLNKNLIISLIERINLTKTHQFFFTFLVEETHHFT